jgi:hypothetical protein
MTAGALPKLAAIHRRAGGPHPSVARCCNPPFDVETEPTYGAAPTNVTRRRTGVSAPIHALDDRIGAPRQLVVEARVTSRPSTGSACCSPCGAKPDTSGSPPARDMA